MDHTIMDSLNMDNDYFNIYTLGGGGLDSQGQPKSVNNKVARAGPSSYTPGSSTSRPRKMTSKVWQCFVRETVLGPDGKEKRMARCKFCQKLYTGSGSGMGHLERHMRKCMPIHGHGQDSQEGQPKCVNNTTAGASPSFSTPGLSTSRARKTTSKVWLCFVHETVLGPNGKEKRMARCKFCKKLYTGSESGTGHLGRHMRKCMPKHGYGHDSQGGQPKSVNNKTAGASPSSSALESSTSCARKTTSKVWQCFMRETVPSPDGKEKRMARCKFCKKLYTGSGSGTGHLERHMRKCMPKHRQVDITTQTQLQRNPDGSVMTWSYDSAYARDCLAPTLSASTSDLQKLKAAVDRFQELICGIVAEDFVKLRTELFEFLRVQRDPHRTSVDDREDGDHRDGDVYPDSDSRTTDKGMEYDSRRDGDGTNHKAMEASISDSVQTASTQSLPTPPSGLEPHLPMQTDPTPSLPTPPATTQTVQLQPHPPMQTALIPSLPTPSSTAQTATTEAAQLQPFLRLWNAAGSGDCGIIDVLEANFVKPAAADDANEDEISHDQVSFEYNEPQQDLLLHGRIPKRIRTSLSMIQEQAALIDILVEERKQRDEVEAGLRETRREAYNTISELVEKVKELVEKVKQLEGRGRSKVGELHAPGN